MADPGVGKNEMTKEQFAEFINPSFNPTSLIGPGIGAVGSVLGAYMQMKQQEDQFNAEMAFREKEFQQQKKLADTQQATSNRSQNLENAGSAVRLNNYILDRGMQQSSMASMLKGLGGTK